MCNNSAWVIPRDVQEVFCLRHTQMKLMYSLKSPCLLSLPAESPPLSYHQTESQLFLLHLHQAHKSKAHLQPHVPNINEKNFLCSRDYSILVLVFLIYFSMLEVWSSCWDITQHYN